MEFERNFKYFQWKEELREYFEWFAKRCVGFDYYWDEFVAKFEEEWLGHYSEFANDDRLSFCVIFTLAKLEIELDLLSPFMKETYKRCYEDFQNEQLDGLFRKNELHMIYLDFVFCNSYIDKKYNEKSVKFIKYYKLHTGNMDDGCEKTFNDIPLFETDSMSVAITMFSNSLLGKDLPDDYNPKDTEGYAAKKHEFFEKCNEASKTVGETTNIAEYVLDYQYNKAIKENGMKRLAYTIFAMLYQIQYGEVTAFLMDTIEWMIQAFEQENYRHLFDEEDFSLLTKDVELIKNSLFD